MFCDLFDGLRIELFLHVYLSCSSFASCYGDVVTCSDVDISSKGGNENAIARQTDMLILVNVNTAVGGVSS